MKNIFFLSQAPGRPAKFHHNSNLDIGPVDVSWVNIELGNTVSSRHHETKRPGERCWSRRGSRPQQRSDKLRNLPGANVEAAQVSGRTGRLLVVDPTTPQAGLRRILQIRILKRMTGAHKTTHSKKSGRNDVGRARGTGERQATTRQ